MISDMTSCLHMALLMHTFTMISNMPTLIVMSHMFTYDLTLTLGLTSARTRSHTWVHTYTHFTQQTCWSPALKSSPLNPLSSRGLALSAHPKHPVLSIGALQSLLCVSSRGAAS